MLHKTCSKPFGHWYDLVEFLRHRKLHHDDLLKQQVISGQGLCDAPSYLIILLRFM